MIRTSVICAVVLVGASLVAILAGAFLSRPCDQLDTGARYDVAVVLGAGMDPDGTLHQSARERVEAGVVLFDRGIADSLFMTGGRGVPGGPSAGAQMRLHGESLGVPRAAMASEDESQSTLQNALFSRPFLQDTQSRILVTEGFHLTRAWLSFRWAGLPVDKMCYSTRFRARSPQSSRGPVAMLVREIAAFWMNIVRAAVWSGLNAIDRPRDSIDALLR